MRTRIVVLSVIALMGVWGCGKKDSPGSPSANAPAKPNQLTGSWVHTTPADMGALEFMSNGKVQVYIGGGDQAMTSDYAVLDDGRLSISMGGLTSVYVPSISGDQLQLKDPDTGRTTLYRRLNSGETISSAMASQDQAEKNAIAGRNAALPDFLKRKDLVMVLNPGGGGPNGGAGFVSGVMINGSKDAPPHTALEFGPANGNDYTGGACYDTQPRRLEPVAARIAGSAEKPIVSMIFGPGTVDQNGGRGVVDFHLEGSAPNITLKASLDYGGPRLSDLVIKSDPAMHKQILDRSKT